MRSIRQLLRHPMKTLSGIILMTAAVAVLCICLGQSLVAAEMEANKDELFTSVALLTDQQQYYSYYDEEFTLQYIIHYSLPQEVSDWIDETAEKYPHIVEQVHRAGLASAYIPELNADNPASHFVNMSTSNVYYQSISGDAGKNPQRQAMLQIRLDRLGEVTTEEGIVSQSLTGTIEQVLGLQEGYADPTGYTARIELQFPDRAALDALELTVGQSYLVYTTDYYDVDWELRCEIALGGTDGYKLEAGFRADESPILISQFDPDNLVWLVKDVDWEELPYQSMNNVAYYTQEEIQPDGSIKTRSVTLTRETIFDFRAVELTVQGMDGVPSIAPLEGSVEDFLASEAGEIWQEYLTSCPVNYHAFPVVGVEDLMAVGDFALERAWISRGRNFTQEELDQGAKVCIISQEVAELSGLTIGDTISLQFYTRDENLPDQPGVDDGIGVINPNPWYYGPDSALDGDAQEYTIVGLYNKNVLWQGASSMYEFIPNTVFAPKASIAAQMEEGDLGIFQSIILANGAMDEFEAIALRDGYEGQFQLTDQGYGEVTDSLHNYREVADQAVLVGGAVYLAIVSLFLMLFPAQERKNLKIMDSMGANRREKMDHMMISALGILVPATVAGFAAGTLLWERVVANLMDSTDSSLVLELNIWLLAGIAAAQLAIGALLTAGVSVPMTRSRGLKSRESFLRRIWKRMTGSRLKGSTVLIFAMVVSMVLCGLSAANEAELESYEESYHSTPVKVTLVRLSDNDAYHLQAGSFIQDLFTDERYAKFTPQKYLKDTQIISSITVDSVNYKSYPDVQITPLETGVEVDWWEGYSAEDLRGSESMVIVPQDMIVHDQEKFKVGTQVVLRFELTTGAGVQKENFMFVMTVAGTHNQGDAVYCSENWIESWSSDLNVTNLPKMITGTLESMDSSYETVMAITSQANPIDLTSQRNCEIHWVDGYSAQDLDGEEPVVLVPENRDLKDMDKETPGTQIMIRLITYSIPNGTNPDGTTRYRDAEYELHGTVIGTYSNSIDSQDIYCSYHSLEFAAARINSILGLDYISATVKNNDEIEDLRTMANQWFADPDQELDVTKKYEYALDIDDSTLDNLKQTLNNSIRINEICTLLVFILTAGAGFFLGFLMVRGRKREIILMRTLGKPNASVFLDFVREQMLWVLLGVGLGGAVFLWQPAERLGLFVVIYFAGLSGALLLFLRSTLLTTMKEAE